MSYVEHGPRVFLIGRHNNNMPLAYGDYIVPKKRLEGRLKMYESCSDIRAWSSNPLETSRYFRELAEHTSLSGKIIPFNVVVENIIGLTSQAQNELQILRKELKKYKSLKLTTEQEKHLQTFDNQIIADYQKEKQYKDNSILKASLKESFKIIDKSISLPHLDSYLSIQFNHEQNIQYNDRHYRGFSLFNQIDSLSCKASYLLPKLKSIYFSSKSGNVERNKHLNVETDILTNLEDKYTQVACIEYADISVQVIWDMYETGTQTDCLMEYITSSETKISSIRIESESESNSITESEFDSEFNEKSHKEIIIQKDSEIIALKNEFSAKEAEVEELEIMLKEKDETLGTLRRGLKLYTNTCIMEQLKMELTKKCDFSFLQSQEIEKLRLHVKDTAILLAEKDSLVKKVKEMEHLSKEAENYRLTLDELKTALCEKDEIQKQNLEQKCILNDQEDEIKRLLILIQQMSSTHNDQQTVTLENVKKHSKESICSSHLNYHFISSDSNSEVDESNAMMLKRTQTSQKNLLENIQFSWANTETINNAVMHEYTDFENHSNKDTSEPDSWNSAKTEVSILTINDNTNIENMVVEEVSRSLIKMQFLMKQLQVYAERERPSLIKQIHDLYKVLIDNKSVIVWSPESQETLIKNKLLDLNDEYIDKIFTTQFKCSINKLNELSKALKEKIRMGEGDCVRPEKSEWDMIKENFRALDVELNQKNQLIKQLQDTHKSNNVTLSALHLLQEENTNLRKKLDDANEIIWGNNKLIKDLKDKQEDDKHNFASTLLEYNTLLAKRENIINNLEKIEKDNTEKLLKIQNLIHEVENKNLEIENLRNRVNDLSEENDSLCKQLMFHKGNYEDKLTILKKKYDSSIKDASTEIQHKQTKLQEDKLRILKNHNLKLKNHDSSKTLMNLQKHSLHNKDENKSKVKNFFRNIAWEETIFFDPTSHTNKYKNILNSRLNNNEKKYANRNVTSISANRTITKNTIDWQRNNFIYQCSVHHKKSNIC
ncbi:PREDICTED: putative leucine-rich repeat-containing protein DDB_G0290503 [Polistes canadensis]|uniref:putative leucine-rich repeat-containing protein DDB_G0290503 n=1 Tax=Polistes canadensis TaxID=91411 RepID=UPI000718D9B4|nr:PREDICTED: putative leucine-rich repeat-containing protein DDB_G0290503 [Polistes canadensis]